MASPIFHACLLVCARARRASSPEPWARDRARARSTPFRRATAYLPGARAPVACDGEPGHEVVLVRHGETVGWTTATSGLTPLSASARPASAARAGQGDRAGTDVRMPHAQTARAHRDGRRLRAALVDELAGRRSTAPPSARSHRAAPGQPAVRAVLATLVDTSAAVIDPVSRCPVRSVGPGAPVRPLRHRSSGPSRPRAAHRVLAGGTPRCFFEPPQLAAHRIPGRASRVRGPRRPSSPRRAGDHPLRPHAGGGRRGTADHDPGEPHNLEDVRPRPAPDGSRGP